MEFSEKISAILDSLPAKPGCYLMKDQSGGIIYIGKAVSLRSRVRSYFHAAALSNQKTRQLVERIEDIEWIVVGSELEALILEMNLIKKHRPHYNVRLKDDKRYPYIKVHWADDFPKVTITRNLASDGSRYFGPYTSAWAVHQTLDVLRRIFPYLTCDRVITGQDERACLYLDIKLCTAPCIGLIQSEEYRLMIDDLCNFLQGRTDPILTRLQAEMETASRELRYEKAAVLRDQILAIQNVVERQKIISNEYIDSDVIAIAREKNDACAQVFFIRGGKLIGREYFLLEGAEDAPEAEVLTQFIEQYYNQAPTIPPQLLLPVDIEEINIIRQWMNSRQEGQKVEILVPKEGIQKELIQMAAENAAETLTSIRAQWEASRHKQTEALSEIQQALGLAEPPNRIECFDISNTQGTAAVGSMVVFEQGVPKKSLYRRFNIRSVTGPDDYASMEEVLDRRFSRYYNSKEAPSTPGKKPDVAFSRLPDLLLIDGGKGQLGRAVQVLEKHGLRDLVAVASLAKEHEELFIPGRSRPILLPRQSQGLFLVQRVRDEAHRYAVTSHRNRRTRQGLASRLETIPGIGPARRKVLLGRFGSVDRIREASVKELVQIPGISEEIAEAIKANLD
ncbi:MAG TPA: excinuclease ABC subunit UvrC [Anaerolineales bacterium]|nr:excinuclease ABC subunit UvrC [Anaerolineales bacterium]